MRFMLPTFTPSFDNSFSDSIPTFGKPRPTTSIRRQPQTRYVDKTSPRKKEEKVEPKLTLRILPTWLISKFAAYPWVGTKGVNTDHYRPPIIP